VEEAVAARFRSRFEARGSLVTAVA